MKRWLGYAAVGLLIEAHALRTAQADATLSYATRTAFCTSNRAGRAAFAASWIVLSVWFVPHILHAAAASVADSIAES